MTKPLRTPTTTPLFTGEFQIFGKPTTAVVYSDDDDAK